MSGAIIGLSILAVGFLMVWRQRNFREYVGDLGGLFGLPGSNWLTWPVLGTVLMLVGFFTIFGVFQIFVEALIRRLLVPSLGGGG